MSGGLAGPALGDHPARRRPPRSVTLAVRLAVTALLLGAAIPVLRATVLLDLDAAYGGPGSSYDVLIFHRIVEPTVPEILLGVAPIVGAPLVLVALLVLVRRGRAWARVALSLAAAVALVPLLVPLFRALAPIPFEPPSEAWARALSAVDVLIVLAAGALLWLPASRPWFRARVRPVSAPEP